MVREYEGDLKRDVTISKLEYMDMLELDTQYRALITLAREKLENEIDEIQEFGFPEYRKLSDAYIRVSDILKIFGDKELLKNYEKELEKRKEKYYAEREGQN